MKQAQKLNKRGKKMKQAQKLNKRGKKMKQAQKLNKRGKKNEEERKHIGFDFNPIVWISSMQQYFITLNIIDLPS
jgi:hypothetical protein